MAQTRARVLQGDTHDPGKVVSLFEPHTEIIRKGKLAKPTEFGRLVKIMSVPSTTAASDMSCCRARRTRRARDGPERRCDGGREVKDASVP